MSIPHKLTQAISQAHTAIQKDPQHDLRPGYRQAIWSALGPQLSNQQTQSSGLIKRTILATTAVKHVLPIWENARPTDTRPHHILTEIERVLNQKNNRQQMLKGRDSYWV